MYEKQTKNEEQKKINPSIRRLALMGAETEKQKRISPLLGLQRMLRVKQCDVYVRKRRKNTVGPPT